MKNRIKKHKFNIFIATVFMMLSTTPFISSNAMFTDVEIQPVGIQITTGIFDITLKDNLTGNVGALNYIGNINQGSLVLLKENLSVENIGTLTNDLSVKSSFSVQPGDAEKFRIELVKSNGQSIDISGNSYVSLNGFMNSGDRFTLKVSYNGLLPTSAKVVDVEITFRGTQPNDQQNNPKMYTDTEKIKYTINVAAQNNNSDFEFASQNGNFRYSLKEFNMYYGYEGNNLVPYNYGKIKVLVPTNIDHNNLEINFYYSAPKYIKKDFDPSTRVLTLYFESNGITSREYSFMKYTGQVAINVMNGQSVVINDQIKFYDELTSRPGYAYEIGFSTDGLTTLQNNGNLVAKLNPKNINVAFKKNLIRLL